MKLRHGTRALVTGAGSGLGRALSLELARRGARLWLADIDLSRAEASAAQCLASGASEAIASRLDVREARGFETLRDEVTNRWGGLELVVNNAGVAAGGPFEEQSLEDWRWIVETNLWGVIHGCHFFFPLLQQSQGHILNVASAAGFVSPPLLSSYNTTKAAVIALSESLAAESRESGVAVTVVCPTFFETNILSSARLSREELREDAKKLFDRATCTAETVASHALRAIEKRRLYALPSWDCRVFWRMKRLSPSSLGRIAAALMPNAAARTEAPGPTKAREEAGESASG